MKLDDTNIAIIKELRNGRKAFSSIADKIGITENTVRSRVNKLIEDGVLQISGLVDPQYIPEMQVVVMGVKLSTLNLEDKAKEMLQLKGVISVMVVTGRYDLIVQLATSTQDDQSLLNFFKNELSKVKGVSDVETFVVYQSH
ncbi:MAG: Lrp/AsnC family transcriptional regulator, partial [Spirochaetales bacterium]|nr:Lrp/AsnC family transcriptional regulator [Spirochaetales bacterium]